MSQTQMTMFGAILAAVLLVLVFQPKDAEGCFITNCPPGGKRSIGMSGPLGSNHIRRECTRCGPSLTGRCYGSDICCSPLMGCNIGGFVSARCAMEAYNPTLCSNPGAPCGPNGKGVCALNATCCTNDGCFIDKSCTQAEPDFNLI